jgi:TIR domain-containing protein
MIMTARPDGSPQPPGYYFFLSYAHSAPLEVAEDADTPQSDSSGIDADPVVASFYTDLRQTVAALVRPGRADIGFLDQDLPPGSDLRVDLAAALGSAQVFVPLYSPGYFTRSWPLREQAAFRRRLLVADVNPESRIVPIVWTPVLPTDQQTDVRRALAAANAFPEYRENGLRALFLLESHRSAYEAFRAWLAAEIVAVAERSPLEPSAAVNLEEVEGSTVKEARFLVGMLDPGEIPARAHPWWRAYAAPITQHAATLADRLGLRSEVTDVAEAEQLFERTPGIVLVDPWPAGDRAESITARLRGLPPWVVPVVLEEPRERLGEQAAALAATISRVKNAVTGRVESVSDMSQLEQILPGLVARARRRYLRQVQIDGISGSGRRPRLRDLAE